MRRLLCTFLDAVALKTASWILLHRFQIVDVVGSRGKIDGAHSWWANRMRGGEIHQVTIELHAHILEERGNSRRAFCEIELMASAIERGETC